MDDGSCVVCAETLEWVAYGPCGHRDVCATCIARLRFVCDDHRCCICKSLSNFVFVTKALGSFTRVINDFSILPADAKDGKVGQYWFHESIQAYFDDCDEYKIIKAMCRLSCSFCDKLEAEGRKNSNRRNKFKSIEQLKDHLSRQHELFFCSLCLENKKVFICEQKLYTRGQLRQHIKDGDSEVDGDETERCGFSGHPLCEFCQIPFYGDNELYFHMSTEHYTCHICQRHGTQYEYYKDYNELENHFRRAHFLCEDGSCLDKKFIVFASEADMKRHTALEHGEHMSRSKRNTALQLPTCFRHREREEEARRIRARATGRGVRVHVTGRGLSDHQLSSTTPASAERNGFHLPNGASSIRQAVPDRNGTREAGATSDPVSSSGQAQDNTLDFRSVLLSSSAFPSLPRTSKRRRRKSKKASGETSADSEIAPCSTPVTSPMASSAVNHPPALASSSSHSRGPISAGLVSQSTSVNPVPPSSSNDILSAGCANSLSNSGSKDVGSSSSAPNLVDGPSISCSVCDDPPLKKDDVETANKSLVEGIHAALEFDKDKFAAFKIISKEYRDGEIDAGEYLAYVHQFGLAHLILDLARLCPDPQKQKELMEIHKMSLGDVKENGPRIETSKRSGNKVSNKGKEKCEDSGSSSKAFSDSIGDHLKELKLNTKPQKEEPTSSRVMDCPAQGKSRTPSTDSRNEDVSPLNGSPSKNSLGTTAEGSKNKAKKKSSKFLKNRLGESSASVVVPSVNCSDLASDPIGGRPNQDAILAAARGVWRNGGGRKLVAMSLASPSTR